MSKEVTLQYMYSYPHKTAYRPLEGVDVEAYFSSLGDGQNSLYLHIPFCQAKCGYCNLFSVVGAKEELIEAYIEAMARQLAQYDQIVSLKSVSWQSVILGGGTPILLSIPQLEQIFATVESYLGISLGETFTAIEAAPKACTGEKLTYLRERGVDRISLGVQSFKPSVLKTLGRIHTNKDSRYALALIKKLDFPQVNVDLIYDIPGQSQRDFEKSLEEALSYEPDELFIYPLYVKPLTPMAEAYPELTVQKYPSSAYYMGMRALEAKGYQQRSMRRFLRQAPEEEQSCGFENMLSIGCGGRSYLGNLHFSEPYAVGSAYCQQILVNYSEKTDFLTGLDGYVLDKDEQMRRYIIKNLLNQSGLDLNELHEKFGEILVNDSYRHFYDRAFDQVMTEENNRLTLNKRGFMLSDELGPRLISQTVKEKMQAYVRK